ncbi:aminotransferase class V-fold PLP-dependent enzyme [Schlesneria paludicola]|uniref:aminotransferase class V-fold PLP-dependent enzyme n=1 Tax=Schlesneria paludicola TaxID=360056 RepID=UPI0012FC70B8|nr:aminotransferase class V-fold PLP-dependent enzyme [Schlesneria paludicola]
MDDSFPPRMAWSIPDDVVYLNHGSFGATPVVVQEAREDWSRRLARQPMEFFLKQMEPALDAAAAALGKLIRADPRDLVLVDNATVAMNIVAENIALAAGDEVILNDHEYGAVVRIWRQKCEEAGARLVIVRLGDVSGGDPDSSEPESVRTTRLTQVEDIVEPILNAVTDRTRLIVVSHVTSPSAILFPVAEICRRAKSLGVPVCVDGPHAIAMQDVDLRKIDCDFYCASLHKWLSAPFGSGFLFVRRARQSTLRGHMTSWGRSLGGFPARWQDQLNWLGTRDPAALLAVPSAIQFLEKVGLAQFRERTHELARTTREKLETVLGQPAWIPDSPEWYGSMIAVPLSARIAKKRKPNSMHPLQRSLCEEFQIEVPITECRGTSLMRVSCHLYNTHGEIDRLMAALDELIPASDR